MDDDPVGDPIDLAERAARAGAEVATARFRTDFDVREKGGAMDPVTVADTETQDRIVEVLREAGAEASIVGEEGDASKTLPGTGRAWVIDPIDGTNNFARASHPWAVCVAAAEDREPIGGATVLPAFGETYVAGAEGATRDGAALSVSAREDPGELIVAPVFGLKDRDRAQYRAVTGGILESFGDVRQTGSGQTTLALVAGGGVDAAVSTVPMAPWNTLVGVSLVRGAGGRVTDMDGERWRPDCESLVATNGACHDAVREVLGNAVDP
jgi:myo-inositol-1(or 4)-monophosphatase